MSLEPASSTSIRVQTCASCGAELAPTLLSCPSCRRLVHADRLKALAEAAETAERDDNLELGPGFLARGDLALAPWHSPARDDRRANRQAGTPGGIEPGASPAARPSSDAPTVALGNGQSASSGWSKGAASGVAGTLALAAWKFKFLAFMVLSKGKLLLLGLTKASTFLSMFAMVGVYWTAFGFWFAVGLVLSIYIHEMGHVAALTRYGVPASAPLFIPGLGAVIRLRAGIHRSPPGRAGRPGRPDLGSGRGDLLRLGIHGDA